MNQYSRREALKAAGVAVGLPRVGAVRDQSQSAGAWPLFGYDERNSAHSPAEGPKRDISQRWRFGTGGAITSSPVVADGIAYVGSDGGTVSALDAATGDQKWQFETGGSVSAAPAAVDGTVYAGSHDNSLYALDAASGTRQWTFETGDRIGAAPTVSDGTVYVGSHDNFLYALDANSGSEQWRVETGSIITTTPAVVGDTAYFGSADTRVYAVDIADGGQQWTFETDNGVNSSPAVVDGVVYVGSSDGHLYALDVATGEEKWAFSIGGIGGPSPAVADGRVYVSEGVAGNKIHAVDAATGEEVWTGQTGASVRSSPAVADGVVYVGSSDKNVYAIDAAGGELLWRFETGGGVSSSPAIVGDTVYIGSDDTNLYALTGPQSRQPTTTTSTPTPTPTPSSVLGLGGVGGVLSGLLGAVGIGAGAWWLYRRGTPSEHGPPPDPFAQGERKVPDEIPRAPDVAVEYNALRDETTIGSGDTADVTRATMPTEAGDVTVAIKKPHLSGTLHVETIEQLLSEAATWAKLDDHDHIVGVVDYGSEPLPWIAMEYMDGGHLGERTGEMDALQALWTALAVTKGVHHAHRRGVPHLNLKPANVLFRTAEDAWDVPKVSDWCLSKHLHDRSERVDEHLSGYAAPEQFDESYGAADDITDIYQLGAVFYELFTGRPPFEGTATDVRQAVLEETPTPPSEVADVPPALDDVLLTALETEKADRYDSVVYLRDALQDLYEP